MKSSLPISCYLQLTTPSIATESFWNRTSHKSLFKLINDFYLQAKKRKELEALKNAQSLVKVSFCSSLGFDCRMPQKFL